MSLITKISQAMADVGAVGKTGRNEKQGYNFRGIDAVVSAVSPALRAQGVVVSPTVIDYTYETVEIGQNRTPMGHVRVIVRFAFTDGSETLEATVPGEAMDSGDKATAKAMSVAFRTCLLQTLCLPTDEADPDEHSYERTSSAPVVNERHPAAQEPDQPLRQAPGGNATLATEQQKKMIWAISKSLDKLPPVGLDELTKYQASQIIDELKAEQLSVASDEEVF